jgi:ABC-2 type transport system ATP-binding protein
MQPDNDIVVRTIGLTKVFRDFWLREKVTAVKELDLDINRAEVYGLLGPNGSGKSTTLKMILGLMFPSRGRLTVLGKRPTDVAVKSRIGFLPEESYLYPFLDAYETLDYYGRLFHQVRRERKRRIDMLLDMVGLTGAAFRRVGEYSKGMQRRIGMAQALINDPDLLILDEPTSGMDPLAARQFKDLIQELSRRGKTIILSSHLLSDMEDVCDRVGILYAGQLRSQGTLEELLARRNLTQITTDQLDEPTARQLRELLARHGKQLIAMESPKDKLEVLFLRIVREAQSLRGRGAAAETGQLAQFLRSQPQQEQGRQVLEQLVGQESPQAAAATEPPPVPTPATDRHVLQELLDSAQPAQEPAARAKAAQAAAPDKDAPAEAAGGKEQKKPDLKDVDRGLLDSLTQDAGENKPDA